MIMLNSELKQLLGTAARTQRRLLGMSQEELGGRAGLHRTYIADVERGKRNPSLESMEKMARALELSLPDLLNLALADQPELAPAASSQSVDIIMVDHDPESAAQTVAILNQARVSNRLSLYLNVESAIRHLSNGHTKRTASPPTLILLELELPEMGCQTLLRQLQSNRRTRSIPAVILSSFPVDRAPDRLPQELRDQPWLSKPVQIEPFMNLTNRLGLQWSLQAPLEIAPGRTRDSIS